MAKPKPEASGLCVPVPSSSPRPKLAGRKTEATRAFRCSDAQLLSSPGDAPIWSSSPEPVLLMQQQPPGQHPCPCAGLGAFPPTSCLTEPQLLGSYVFRAGLQIPFLQAASPSTGEEQSISHLTAAMSSLSTRSSPEDQDVHYTHHQREDTVMSR